MKLVIKTAIWENEALLDWDESGCCPPERWMLIRENWYYRENATEEEIDPLCRVITNGNIERRELITSVEQMEDDAKPWGKYEFPWQLDYYGDCVWALRLLKYDNDYEYEERRNLTEGYASNRAIER